jgi:two-component system, response regulator PdtaR
VLARLQSAGPVAAPPKVTAPAAPGLPDAAAAAASTFTFAPATGADPVPIAVGILMHRYSLARGAALQRLQRLAQDNQLGVPAQAERLLLAVEELARSAL